MPHVPSTGWADEFAQKGWADEFEQQQQQQQQKQQPAGPQSWAEEFTHGEGEKWAGEFEAAAAETAAAARRSAGPGEAMAATRRMVEVLGADADPKMRNSQFLQFLSKMSRGELLLEEGGLREVDPAAAAAARQWADEFDERQQQQQQRSAGGTAWADDFARQQQAPCAQQQGQRAAGGDWVDEFARGVADLDIGGDAAQEDLDAAWAAIGSGAVPLAGAADWVREFGGDEAGAVGAAPEEWDALYADAQRGAGAAASAAARGREYAFTDPNPFLGDPQALAKGKDL
jgi:peroxin-5